MLHPAELRFFAFRLSAVRPVQSNSVACTPPRPPAFPVGSQANPWIAQPIIRQLDSPVVWLCCSSPKKKVQSFQAQSKTVSGQASIQFVSTLLAATCPIPCCNQPALSLAAAGQPYDPQGAIKRLTVPSILKVNRHFQTHRWPFVPCRPGMPQGGETHGHGDTAFHGLSLTGKAEQFIFINSHPFPKCGSREIEVWPIQHACKSRAAN